MKLLCPKCKEIILLTTSTKKINCPVCQTELDWNNQTDITTLREQLTDAGFNWTSNWRLVHIKLEEEGPVNGWREGEIEREVITDASHALFDYRYESGYGRAETPQIIAEDDAHIYFPWQYDGYSAICRVMKNILEYMNPEQMEYPYPGSG